ncbi:MAG TPA: 30S ribosomal protein S16 [bacterium]
MVKIRLTRIGRRKIPVYRIVVIDSKKARDGKYIENVGHYDPRTKEVKIDRDRIEYWISKGAQPTVRVAKIIAKDSNKEIEKEKELEPDKEEGKGGSDEGTN